MNNRDNHSLPPPSSFQDGPGRASKRERYLLKKQKKEEERLRRARQKKIRKIVVVSLISLPIILIIGGAVFGIVNYLTREDRENNQGIPKVEVSPEEYDAGTVSMGEGLVEYTYEIRNVGEGDLKIDRIWTSCMCTTARLKVGDEEGEEFGMHSNPVFWSQKIAPGEIGYLEVVFDPAFHGPQGTGPMVREVYLSTDDPQNKKVEVRLIANVIE